MHHPDIKPVLSKKLYLRHETIAALYIYTLLASIGILYIGVYCLSQQYGLRNNFLSRFRGTLAAFLKYVLATCNVILLLV